MTRYFLILIVLLAVFQSACKKEKQQQLPNVDISNCFIRYQLNGRDTTFYYYNAQNMLDSMVTPYHYGSNYSRNSLKREYIYNGTRLDSIKNYQYGRLDMTYHYSYTPGLIEVESISSYTNNVSQQDFWHTDSSGRIVRAEHYEVSSNGSYLTFKENFIYDQWGNVAKAEDVEGGGEYTYIYIYDKELAPKAGLPLDLTPSGNNSSTYEVVAHFGPSNLTEIYAQPNGGKAYQYGHYDYTYNNSHLPRTRSDGKSYSYSCD